MTIKLSPPTTKSNYLHAGFHGILCVLEAISPSGPNIPNVLTNLKSGFGALLGEADDDITHRAWIWAFKTLSYAASDVLRNERFKAPLSAEKDDAVREFLEAATRFDGHELDGNALMNPSLSPLFINAHAALGPMILKATTGADLGVDTLRERFRQALRTGSNRTLCENPAYFRVLEDAFTGLAGEGARRDGHWGRHGHWISHSFTDAPIFSPDEDEIIPLESVYIPLRCFWHSEQDVADEHETNSVHVRAHVAELHDTAHNWLAKGPRHDPILVVTGGPGSGKSSFARAFAHEVIQKDAHRVLFIQLQHMTLTGSLHDDIVRYVDRRDNSIGKNGNPGLPGNPFDWRKTDEKPLLIIFDGLDELSTKEEDGDRYARELLLALKLMIAPLNTDGAPIRALVLGRNLACQAAMKAANIPLKHMVNVAPIAKMSAQTCMLPYQNENNVDDPCNLMVIDQREEYWRKWAALKGYDPETLPPAITAASMEELNVEPLLLHLLMISKYSGAEWELAAKNKNIVYEDILKKIFERNKHKDHFQSAGVTEPLFFELMECLGIAAWRGNGRTGDESEFRNIRKLHLNKERKFKDFAAAGLKSVALNIHTRAGQEDESGGFEFIHKSFGEYLAARGLLSYALKTARYLVEKESEDVEREWCQIIGPAELTTEIINFLYDEAHLRMTPEEALEYKDLLTELINWVLNNGFSVHKISPELAWVDLAERQRSAVSALIASTSAVANTIPVGDWNAFEFNAPWNVNINWPKTENRGTKKILNEIGITIETPIIEALCRINLSDQHLWNTSLSRSNLEGADLRSAVVIRSTLIGVNLEGANLEASDGSCIELIDSKLNGCILSNASLQESAFENVEMRNCNLRNANFKRVSAPLSNRVMLPMSLTNYSKNFAIDLQGADLTGAILIDADLSGALNLSLEMVNSAVGNSGTKLPDYIDRSEVIWLQDGFDQEENEDGLGLQYDILRDRRSRKPS